MDFAPSPRAEELRKRLEAFMDECVYPNEALYHQQIADSGDPHVHAPVLDELKLEARERGLWNLFLPHETEWTDGLSNLDYAQLAEMTQHIDATFRVEAGRITAINIAPR